MPNGATSALTKNSFIVPVGVIRPIWFAPRSVNHRLPSEPRAMSCGSLNGVRTGNCAITPAGVMRPILLPSNSVKKKLPPSHRFVVGGKIEIPSDPSESGIPRPRQERDDARSSRDWQR
jgi:hypothetical protein